MTSDHIDIIVLVACGIVFLWFILKIVKPPRRPK